MLTVLGISIGIGVIFYLVSLGYGFQKLIIDKIATADSLLTLDVIQENEVVKLGNNSLEDLKSIENIVEISPVVVQESKASRDGFVSDLKINIADQNFFKLEGVSVSSGEMLEGNEKDGVILSSAVLRLLNLSEENFSGEDVHLQILTGKKDSQGIPDFTEKKYYVKGIIEDETQAYAYIDRSSAEEISFDNYDKIKIKVSSDDKLEEVRENVINKGYYVSAISDLVEQAKQIFKISQIILSLFGIVALIVSAIGMFNTMTIALLERTQEIGIMKTLGASSSVIWRVFLVESIAIGFSGGVLGILLGYVGGHISNFGINILARNFGGTEVDLFYIPVWFVFFILIFSILVGAFTGFYPARRASKLNALEALRYK
ncbi:MAG: FtsX-like permease family protein [Parcubacteria group bacterium]|jgi:ABC-type lipoprotein release transport system permease subunit